jgi:excisionase family DNA binding protein
MTAKLAPLPQPPYSAAEVARLLGMDPVTVRNAITAKEFPGYRVGKKFVVPREAFERWQRGDWAPAHPIGFLHRKRGAA